MSEEIIMYLVALIPSGVSVAAILGTAIGILKQFTALRAEVKEKVQMKEMQEKLEVVLSENRELQRILKKEIETRTHVREE